MAGETGASGGLDETIFQISCVCLFTSAVSEFSVSSILLHTAGLNKKGVFFLFFLHFHALVHFSSFYILLV